MNINADKGCTELHDACASLPELVRMNYFHGQLISDRDLRTEQDYFRARLRHANRCLHGYGVLCGLELEPVPGPEECRPEDDDRREKLRAAIEEYDEKIEALRESAKAEGADVEAIEEEIRKLEEERETWVRELEDQSGEYPPGQEEEEEDEESHRPKHLVVLGCGAAIDCDGNDIIVRQAVMVDLDDLLKCAPEDPHPHQPEQHDKGEYGKEAQAEKPEHAP